METHSDQSDNVPLRFFRVLAVCAVVSLMFLGLIAALLGRKVFEKIATLLVLPCGIIWYLLICCVVLTFASGKRKLGFAISGVLILYTACGSGHFACLLVRHVESPFTDIHPLETDPLDAVVILGGGGSTGANGRCQGNASGDRIILAAELYHAGIVQQLICTGQRITSMDGGGYNPGEVSMRLLRGLGVPENTIEIMGGENTSEEMTALGRRFKNADSRVGLVTSAWHLPRAMRLAKINGFTPIPLPADFIGGAYGPQTIGQLIMSSIPQAENMFQVSRISKELLAGLVGR